MKELQNIIEIKETKLENTVNEYLKLGWNLIATHSSNGDGIVADSYTSYSLGWMKEKGVPNHPEKKEKRFLPDSHYNKDGTLKADK